MRNIKFKMFGRFSVSSALFWFSILCFITIGFLFIGSLFSGPLRAFTALVSLTQLSFFFIPKLIFFCSLILIFKAFKTDNIFSKKTIRYLHLFTGINFIMALLIVISSKLDGYWAQEIVPVIPLIILGVFSAFIAAIFKQGFQLQQENELTI